MFIAELVVLLAAIWAISTLWKPPSLPENYYADQVQAKDRHDYEEFRRELKLAVASRSRNHNGQG